MYSIDYSNNNPIAVFDSGVGGLSVVKEIKGLIPGYPMLYFADNAYAPYGFRTKEEIIERTVKISSFLINKGAAVIVVACNTATAAAVSTLRERFSIPFVGMEPAVKPAAALSKTGVIGVLATRGTLAGELYNSTLERYALGVKIIEKEGKGLAQLVEDGQIDHPETERLLREYLEPMIAAGADHIVLGCTHYPFLIPAIKKVLASFNLPETRVTIVDPAHAVAKQLVRIVKELDIPIETGSATNPLFFSTGQNAVLKSFARSIYYDIPDDNFSIIIT